MTQAMPFVYSDGGRAEAGFRGSAGDCVVRAVAIATQQPYQNVYAVLSRGTSTQRLTKRSRTRSSARDGVSVRRKWFKDYMHNLDWHWTPTMGIGTGCRVHLLPGELPAGRLVVSVSKHYTAVINGVIHDTHNPSDRPGTIYPPNTLENIPVGSVRPENGNGWLYQPGRCVYGYWSKA